MAEMLGVFVFAFYSSSAPAEYAAWANGLSLAVVGEGPRDCMYSLVFQLISACLQLLLGKPALD